MKLMPVDIAHKSFNKKFMGCDEEEVNAFLGQVAVEYEQLFQEKEQLKEMLREKDLQILEYRDRDKVLKDTISAAQQMSERMTKEAEREAKLILNDANQKADFMNRDSRDQLKSLHREIAELKRIKIQFEANLKMLIQSHMNLIQNQDSYFESAISAKTI